MSKNRRRHLSNQRREVDLETYIAEEEGAMGEDERVRMGSCGVVDYGQLEVANPFSDEVLKELPLNELMIQLNHPINIIFNFDQK